MSPIGRSRAMHESKHNTTVALAEAASGDTAAAARLMPMVYDELRALAARALQRERSDHTLQPTALVHEAFLRLIDQTHAEYKSRTHFFAIAAQVIRRVLVDHARQHQAAKRGGQWLKVTLDRVEDTGGINALDLLGLDEALTRLSALDERQGRVVELRFFGGLSVEETAATLDVSPRTVEEDWRMAKAWLKRELEK
jgi:RNA polymerase sigma factor (TIGR02999 family)